MITWLPWPESIAIWAMFGATPGGGGWEKGKDVRESSTTKT